MKNVVENGEDLEIVGIVQPKEGATSTMLSSGIYYPAELTAYTINNAQNSKIVKEQLANPETNVFTGKRFDDAEEDSSFDMNSLIDVNTNAIGLAFKIDESKIKVNFGNLNNVLTQNSLPALDIDDVLNNIQFSITSKDVQLIISDFLKGYEEYVKNKPEANIAQIGKQLKDSQYITPRARVIDCNILDGAVPENIFIQRIQKAVESYHEISQIFNLSANTSIPIEGDEMSIIGFELDALQLKYRVQFVVSAGNHELWKTETSIDDIIDDDDARIAPPADSMLSIAVGAVVSENHVGSLSGKNIIAPYSRRGPGFAGFTKPDICAYGGTVYIDDAGVHVPADLTSLVLTKNATIESDAGTSFTAPTVAGDLAEIFGCTSNNDILLAKALLYHNAKPLWENEEIENDELAFAHNLYGRGIASVEDSKYSSPSRVTFLRTGSLNRLTKERIKIYMPDILAAQVGRNVARVTVTCLTLPPVDRTKGSEYLGAYIRASLKKSHPDGRLLQVVQDYSEGRKKWDVCCQFTKTFTSFNSGDWQIWLELFSRWDEDNLDVPYALVATIEDVSGTLDVYSEIQAQNRYQVVNNVRIKVDS